MDSIDDHMLKQVGSDQKVNTIIDLSTFSESAVKEVKDYLASIQIPEHQIVTIIEP